MQNFRRVAAWRKAHALLLNVHRAIRRFPREHANLRSQVRRAAESIPTNTVEGCGCASQKEFARFLQHSINSSNELEYHIQVARDYGLFAQRQWALLTEDTEEVRRMTYGLIKKVRGDEA